MGKGGKPTKRGGAALISQKSDNSKNAIPVWKFFCYDTGDQVSLWQAWYSGADGNGADGRARASHDVALEYLEQREHHEWAKTPYFKPLRGGVFEVKIRGPVQHRLLGYFGPNEKEFTFVIACTHKQQRYDPNDAIETAIKRKQQIGKGEKKRISCARPRKI